MFNSSLDGPSPLHSLGLQNTKLDASSAQNITTSVKKSVDSRINGLAGIFQNSSLSNISDSANKLHQRVVNNTNNQKNTNFSNAARRVFSPPEIKFQEPLAPLQRSLHLPKYSFNKMPQSKTDQPDEALRKPPDKPLPPVPNKHGEQPGAALRKPPDKPLPPVPNKHGEQPGAALRKPPDKPLPPVPNKHGEQPGAALRKPPDKPLPPVPNKTGQPDEVVRQKTARSDSVQDRREAARSGAITEAREKNANFSVVVSNFIDNNAIKDIPQKFLSNEEYEIVAKFYENVKKLDPEMKRISSELSEKPIIEGIENAFSEDSVDKLLNIYDEILALYADTLEILSKVSKSKESTPALTEAYNDAPKIFQQFLRIIMPLQEIRKYSIEEDNRLNVVLNRLEVAYTKVNQRQALREERYEIYQNFHSLVDNLKNEKLNFRDKIRVNRVLKLTKSTLAAETRIQRGMKLNKNEISDYLKKSRALQSNIKRLNILKLYDEPIIKEIVKDGVTRLNKLDEQNSKLEELRENLPRLNWILKHRNVDKTKMRNDIKDVENKIKSTQINIEILNQKDLVESLIKAFGKEKLDPRELMATQLVELSKNLKKQL